MVADTPVAVRLASPLRRALGLTLVLLILCAAVFGGARRLDWPGGWVGVLLVFGGLVFQDVYVRRHNPGLFERRRRQNRAAALWDRLIVYCSQLATPALFLVCAADGSARYPAFPPAAAWLAGVVLWACGQGLVAWAMGTNLFFEGTVRLQEEEGHHVISHGPYRFVRHPGYAGLLLFAAAIPLLFGSPWGAIPAALFPGWIIPRILGEERMLLAQLSGYADYARRVRWRLVPFVF